MIVACIGMLSSTLPDPVNTIGKFMHEARTAQHEHDRTEAYVPFEDATSEFYFAGISDTNASVNSNESYFSDAIGINALCNRDIAYTSFLHNTTCNNDSFGTCVSDASRVAKATHSNNIGVGTEPDSSHRKPPVLGGGVYAFMDDWRRVCPYYDGC